MSAKLDALGVKDTGHSDPETDPETDDSHSSAPSSSVSDANKHMIIRNASNGEEIDISIVRKIGSGSNGVVFKSNSERFGGDMVLKITKMKEKLGKGINFYCTHVLNSAVVHSVFPDCNEHIMCVYGIVVNSNNFAQIVPTTKRALMENNLLFIDEDAIDSQVGIFYEFINGRTIREFIESGEPIDFLNYGRQILETLSLLQENELVHLDIKPENIMIDYEGRVKFIDTEYLCKKSNFKCKVVGLSAGYASPEAYDSMLNVKYPNKDYLLKSDVFSTGLVLYEMLMKKKGMSSIFHFGKNASIGELDLDLSEEFMMWKPLLQQMVVRDYNSRISCADALTMFNSIATTSHREGGRKKRRNTKRRRAKSYKNIRRRTHKRTVYKSR
jgi:serine/threonine protein kinase